MSSIDSEGNPEYSQDPGDLAYWFRQSESWSTIVNDPEMQKAFDAVARTAVNVGKESIPGFGGIVADAGLKVAGVETSPDVNMPFLAGLIPGAGLAETTVQAITDLPGMLPVIYEAIKLTTSEINTTPREQTEITEAADQFGIPIKWTPEVVKVGANA